MEVNHSNIGPELQGKVSTSGLCGTYDDGLKFIQEGGLDSRATLKSIDTSVAAHYSVERVVRDASPSSDTSSHNRTEVTEATPPSTPGGQQPLHLLFLGSSLGNFPRGEDTAFLKSLPLRPGLGDTLLVGLDHGCDAKQIEAAYNDSKGITRSFIMNGLTCAGRALGNEKLFDQNKWEYVGRYNAELRKPLFSSPVVENTANVHACIFRPSRGVLQVDLRPDRHRPGHGGSLPIRQGRAGARRDLEQGEAVSRRALYHGSHGHTSFRSAMHTRFSLRPTSGPSTVGQTARRSIRSGFSSAHGSHSLYSKPPRPPRMLRVRRSPSRQWRSGRTCGTHGTSLRGR